MFGGIEREMDMHLGQIQKEPAFLVLSYEFDTFLYIAFGQAPLVWLFFDYFIAMQQRKRRRLPGKGFPCLHTHVIGIGKPIILIETEGFRQTFPLVPHMPFPDTGRSVASFLEKRREGIFFRIQAKAFPREQDSVESYSRRIATTEQACPGRSADRRGTVGIGKQHTLLGQLVYCHCPVQGTPIAPKISITQIVAVDQNNIRQCILTHTSFPFSFYQPTPVKL
jgi:hypothetical protein